MQKELNNSQNKASHIREAIVVLDKTALPSFYASMAKLDKKQFIKFIADQALGRDAEGGTGYSDNYNKLCKTLGKELVDASIKAYPLKSTKKFNNGGELDDTYRRLLEMPKESAIDIIKSVLLSDSYYYFTDNTLDIVSENSYNMFLFCFEHNESNPYSTKLGDKLIFKPDQKLINREPTYLNALIKYAAHFFTQKLIIFTKESNEGIEKRALDKSKSNHFSYLVESIINPDKKLTNEKKPNSVYYFKYFKEKDNTLVCFNLKIEDNTIIECVTFMPDKKAKWLENQIAAGTYKDVSTATNEFLLLGDIKDSSNPNSNDDINYRNSSKIEAKIDELFESNKKKFLKGGELIKRADGHYSRHGLWDSIRENAGSGRKPTAEMLKQESKLKKMEQGGEILLAPNGKPSNLTPEQYKLVRTPEFKAWFGDFENDPENASKVVDENGEPMVMYRGQSGTFEEHGATFNYGKKFMLNKKKTNMFGFFFTTSISAAKDYADNGYILECFLNVRKIADLTYLSPVAPENVFNSKLKELGLSGIPKGSSKFNQVWALFDKGGDNLRRQFMWSGYNGVIFLDDSARYEKAIVVFLSSQIKLADGTNKTFDMNNPDIRYEAGGVVVNDEGVANDGTKGGIFKGARHSEGGIDVQVIGGGKANVEDGEPIIVPEALNEGKMVSYKGQKMTTKEVVSAINQKAGGVPIKKEGGYLESGGNMNQSNEQSITVEPSSVIITRGAILDDKKHEFEGEMLTNKEILSRINQMGGGAAFEEGGKITEAEIMQFGSGYKYFDFERQNIPIEKIRATEQWSLDEDFVEDVKKHGIKVPIVVTYDEDKGLYYVRNGNHRIAAAKLLGIKNVPCLIAERKNELKEGGNLNDCGCNHEKGGKLKKEDLMLCENCGWVWDVKDSEPIDKYVCYACGHNNYKPSKK